MGLIVLNFRAEDDDGLASLRTLDTVGAAAFIFGPDAHKRWGAVVESLQAWQDHRLSW